MDKRKIQSVGGGTYTVSLPKNWAVSQEIETGDTVTVDTHVDGILTLQADGSPADPTGRVVVAVDDSDTTTVEQLLRSAYGSGVTEVVFVTEDRFGEDEHRTVERVARHLTGVSVVETSMDRIRVETLLDTGEVSVPQTVRQLEHVALSMHREATTMVVEGTSQGSLADRDDQADRLWTMVDRSVSRGLGRLDEMDALGLTRPELFELWRVSAELERVADHAEAIGRLATDSTDPLDADTASTIDRIGSIAREEISKGTSVILGDADVEAATSALAMRDHVREVTASAVDGISGENASEWRVSQILHRLRRTAEHGGNVAEVGIEKTVRTGDRIQFTSERIVDDLEE